MIRSPILIYTYIFFIYMIIYYVIRYTDGETFWLNLIVVNEMIFLGWNAFPFWPNDPNESVTPNSSNTILADEFQTYQLLTYDPKPW